MAQSARQMPLVDSSDQPAIVVFHKDGTEPARGSWFAADNAMAAKKGAKADGFQTLVVKSNEALALANRVPKGRVFERSGKLFMPRIQNTVFEQLAKLAPKKPKTSHLQVVDGSAAEAGDAKEAPASERKAVDGPVRPKGAPPQDWSKMGVGSLVLTRDIEEDDEAFYLAVVVGKVNATTYTLKWRDYPEIDPITRDVTQLALLHPKVDVTELDWEIE
ncbi:hypothetical protein ATL17_1277 [Maritalea mobilis]|uniref:Uncharacterized protein n=1 Tax=Maritalea mobilis TaxID=483324 RepID=A0A4V3DBN7_9HYPH|nr:hypothetical protein [Maritalea mobilis]TDQ67268.1 hypothetical protein ATL17_1277 [Maritalea mobilis]